MINIRPFEINDVKSIDDIYRSQESLGVPSLSNVVSHAVITKDETVVGYGSVKLFAEAYLLLLPSLSRLEKTRAIMKSLELGIKTSKEARLEQLFLITDDRHYSDLLKEHYKFKEVPGKLLMLDLGEENGK